MEHDGKTTGSQNPETTAKPLHRTERQPGGKLNGKQEYTKAKKYLCSASSCPLAVRQAGKYLGLCGVGVTVVMSFLTHTDMAVAIAESNAKYTLFIVDHIASKERAQGEPDRN
jgi:hypothetical protein